MRCVFRRGRGAQGEDGSRSEGVAGALKDLLVTDKGRGREGGGWRSSAPSLHPAKCGDQGAKRLAASLETLLV